MKSTSKPAISARLPRMSNSRPTPAIVSNSGKPIATGMSSTSGTIPYASIKTAKISGSSNLAPPAKMKMPPSTQRHSLYVQSIVFI